VLVAAIQVGSGPDPTENRQQLSSWISRAVSQGAGLVVLPEASQRSFGYSDDALAPDAEELEGPFVEMLLRAVGDSGAHVVAGMFERSGGSAPPFNTTVVVGSGGVLGVYRKLHLYDALGFRESAGITPGPLSAESLCVVDVDGWRVGVQTCFDLRFPEISRALIDHGAEALVLGAAWVPGPRKVDQWSTLLGARAIESTAYVVAAAQPGPRYCGHSVILGPEGERLSEAAGEGDELLVAELSKGDLAAVRASMPVIEARRLRIEDPQ